MKAARLSLPLALLAALALPRAVAQENASFEITEIRFHIEGTTQQWILAKLLAGRVEPYPDRRQDLYVGRTFASRAELDAAIAGRTQLLLNERTLASARIEAAVEPRAGAAAAVRLDVYTKDTWNLIGVPYFKYDSNSGLLLALRGRDYNFLGSMQTLNLNLDYTYTETHVNEWGAKTSFELPFELLLHDWTWDVSAGFTYDPDNFGLDLETTLGIELPLWPGTWTLSYTQGYHIIRQDEELKYPSPDGSTFITADDDYYNESKVSFGTSIPTGWYLPALQEVKYNPSVFVDVKYKAQGELSDSYRGFQPGFSHALAAERVDWIGNFRSGASATLSNTIAYSLSTDKWLPGFNGDVSGYKAAGIFAFSARVSGFYTPESINTTDAAANIRGILDNRMSGNVGAFWNSDILLKVFTIPKFVEGQGGIFFDVAAVTDTHRSFDPSSDFTIGVGLEAIGFPLFARSLYMRASAGFDLFDVLSTKSLGGSYKRELFIGFGYFY